MRPELLAKLAKAAIVGGAAGAVGTVAMDLLWFRRARRGGETANLWQWETAQSTTGYARASAPAQGAQRVASLVGHPLPERTARTTTITTHWAMGIGWGAAYAVAAELVGPAERAGVAVAFAPTVMAASYITLGALGVYKPAWQYPAAVLGEDLSAHLLFGATTAAAYEVARRAI